MMQTLLSIKWNIGETGSVRRNRESTVRNRLSLAGINWTFEASSGMGSNKYIIPGDNVPSSVKRLVLIIGYMKDGEYLLPAEYHELTQI